MLAGCQSKPGVAAYVGGTEITIDQVNQIVDEVDSASKSDQQGGIDATAYGDARQSVLGALIIRAAVKRYVDDEGLAEPAVDLDGASQALQLPPSLRYTHLVAEARAYFNLVASKSSPADPTEADLREIYDRVPHGPITYAQARPQIQQIQGLNAALGVRNDVNKIISRYHVVVNPQYRGTEIGILGEHANDGSQIEVVAVPLSAAGDDFVTSS